jgi:regulatory protein
MTALEKALQILARRARTAQEMDRALERAGFAEPERKAALARLRELGYMDDRALAGMRARTRIELGDGPRLAERRLLAQGVDERDAKGAVAEARGEADDLELAKRALERRLRGRKPKDAAEKRRLFRALVSKGHKPGASARALGMEWDGDEELDT